MSVLVIRHTNHCGTVAKWHEHVMLSAISPLSNTHTLEYTTEIDRKIDRQTDKQICKQTYINIDRQKNIRQTDEGERQVDSRYREKRERERNETVEGQLYQPKLTLIFIAQ